MGRYVRGEDGFEYPYRGEASLCDLGYESGIGHTEIFPELCFVGVDQGEDLVFYLNGDTDCIPVDNRERPFDVFRDFFFSVQKYFSNADIGALLDIFEESHGREDRMALLKMMTEAETVYLSSRCYFTLERTEQKQILGWLNTFLAGDVSMDASIFDSPDNLETVLGMLVKHFETHGNELPILAFQILKAARKDGRASFVVHDVEEVWETPVLVDGEVVTATTEIGEFDTPMF